MGLEQLCILLDNSVGVFFPGQTVTGKLHIIIKNEPKLLKGITVECKGLAYVHFTRQHSRTTTSNGETSSHTETVHYTATEEYFKFIIPLVIASGSQINLAVGHHQYPFSFTLPVGIPSSFEGRYGHVRYTLTGSLERSWKWNHTCKIGFNVNSIIDLNLIPEARMPTSSTATKTLGCWCCKSGPITAKAWLSQTGHVPGQTLYLNAEVENCSGKKMRGSRVQLVELTSFHARGATENFTRVIIEKSHGPFEDKDFWTNEPFIIPGLAPSTLPHCNIIHIQYLIQFVVDPGSLAFNMKLPMLLLVGNVPVRSITSLDPAPSYPGPSLAALPSYSTNPNTAQQHKLQSSNSVDYTDLPPPRYEDCFFPGTADVREDGDSTYINNGAGVPFTPRYVTYAPSAPTTYFQ